MEVLSSLIPLLVVVFTASPAREEKVAAGQPVPDFEFRTVLGGDGRTKLSEFRGQPVLIVWYSTVFAGLDGAKLAADIEREVNEELRDSKLVVVLMEIKNHDASYLRALQLAELPGARCWLLKNQELPVTYDDTTGFPPKMILIGVDGTLLYAGSYQSWNKAKKLLQAELAKLEKGWGEDPLARKARALAWGQHKLGEARALLEPALGASASPELTALAAELDGRFDTLVRSVAYLAEQGEPARMARALSEAKAAMDTHLAWSARAAGALDVDRTADSLVAIELELDLDALLKPTLKGKPKKGLDEKLHAFATGKAAGTKVGARAARLADAVAKSMGEL
jgi:hypothetical protein